MPRGGECSICSHEERSILEYALASGVPRRVLAKKHRVSPGALQRHYNHHVSGELREQMAHFIRLQRDPGAAQRAKREPGVLTWYKQQAGFVPEVDRPTHVYMRVPANFCATLYGMNGVPYALHPGQVAKIRAEDAPHLRALGGVEITSMDELRA